MCTSEANQGIHSPLPMGRQVFSHPQDSRAPSRVTVTWKDKRHRSECCLPTPFLFPQAPYKLSMTSYGMKYPFGQFGSPVLCVSPPNSLCTPSHPAGRAVREAEKALALCKHRSTATCLYNKHISVLSTLFPAQIQNISPY